MTMRELREGSVAEMVARIAREHSDAAGQGPDQTAAEDVVSAPPARASARPPRRPGRLFPDAPVDRP